MGKWVIKKIGFKAYTLLMTTIGSFIFALGIDAFIIPHNLVASGVNGLALIIFYVTNIPAGIMNFILNLPILYATYRVLGGWQLLVTIFGTIISSSFMDILVSTSSLQLTHDPLVGAILGGLLCGIGLGIVYRSGGNTGGLDPIALIIRKYWGMQIGSIVFALNFIVLIGSALTQNIETAAIAMITLYLSAIVANKVVIGFNQQKAIFIISYNSDLICDVIITQFGRGATLLEGEGAYTRQEKKVILAVVNLMQVTKLKQAVQSVDPAAFILITDASEVIGQGFTTPTTPTSDYIRRAK